MEETIKRELLTPSGDFSHHAFWLMGDWREQLPVVKEIVQSAGTAAPADIVTFAIDSFLVDQSRELKSLTGGAVVGKTRCFLVAFDRINDDAQQALLKLLEEPAPGAVFIILAPSATAFLPTIVSRLVVVRPAGGARVAGEKPGNDRSALLAELEAKEQALATRLPNLSGSEARSARQALARTRRWLSLLPHANPRLLKDYSDLML